MRWFRSNPKSPQHNTGRHHSTLVPVCVKDWFIGWSSSSLVPVCVKDWFIWRKLVTFCKYFVVRWEDFLVSYGGILLIGTQCRIGSYQVYQYQYQFECRVEPGNEGRLSMERSDSESKHVQASIMPSAHAVPNASKKSFRNAQKVALFVYHSPEAVNLPSFSPIFWKLLSFIVTQWQQKQFKDQKHCVSICSDF